MGRLTRRVELTRRAESDKVKGIFLYENTIDDTNCFLEGEYGYKAFEKLAAYEDIIDDPEKLKLIDKWYSELCKENGQLKKELAEYKKLEEEKKLIKLPCNVGDTVYYVDDIRKFVDECNVTKVDCRTWNRYYMGISIEMQGKLWHCIGAELIGKVAFLTKEEAEQALERMKGDS